MLEFVGNIKLPFSSLDRVVDELHPERHFTVNDIITLIAKLVSSAVHVPVSG